MFQADCDYIRPPGPAGGSWELAIKDDGTGFAPATVNGGGFGLRTMRERAAEPGGILTARSAPGSGTTVTAEFAA